LTQFFLNTHASILYSRINTLWHNFKKIVIANAMLEIFVRIWNVLSMSISHDWQVLLAYLLLNYFSWICIAIWIFFTAFVWPYTIYCIEYSNILYNIKILYIILKNYTQYSNTMYYTIFKYKYNILFKYNEKSRANTVLLYSLFASFLTMIMRQ
jgi:hypothetical protein